MRLLCIILGVFLIYQLSIQPSHAADSIIMRNITSSATITLRPNTTLRRVMANVNERIYIENVERHGSIGRVVRPPLALTTIMASINERIYIENVERHQALALHQLILDNGVPTGTVRRAIQPDQTPRPSMTSTPTATPSVVARIAPSDSPVPPATSLALTESPLPTATETPVPTQP
jgi:hypothetical protein